MAVIQKQVGLNLTTAAVQMEALPVAVARLVFGFRKDARRDVKLVMAMALVFQTSIIAQENLSSRQSMIPSTAL